MRETKFWDDAALEACGSIFAIHDPFGDTLKLRNLLDRFIDVYWANFPDQLHKKVEQEWIKIGACAISLNEQLAEEENSSLLTVDSVVDVLVKKQRDYGHNNIKRFGREGLMIRCHDKVARLENLCGSDFSPNWESIDDTILDIIGYSAIGIMWERQEFLLPLAPPEFLPDLLATGDETR